jgi:hypothetical protein
MRNQLGRRNLSPVDFKLALGRRYNRSKKAKNDGGAGTPKTSVDQNDPQLHESTAAKLATQHGVSVFLVELGNDGKEGAGGILTQWRGMFDRMH